MPVAPWARFLRLLRGHLPVLTEAFCCAVLMTLLGVATSYFIQHLVDSVLVQEETGLLNALGTGMILVVRAPGRVRPEGEVFKVFVPESGQRPGYRVGRQVQEVSYRQGDTVRKGQVLLRLNTRALGEEITRLKLTIRTYNEDLAGLRDRADLLSQRLETAQGKAEVELTQAKEELRRAKQTRALELQQAEAEYQQAQAQLVRLEKLHQTRAAAETELEEARLKTRQTQAKLKIAQQPIDERQVESRCQDLELLEKEYALQRKELEVEQARKEAERDRAENKLATLEQQRERAVLRSPVDGVVTSQEVKTGDILERGQAAVEIAEQGAFYFEAGVSSKEAGHLREGMPVRIKLDAYDFQRYGTLPATVAFVSPNSRVVGDGQANQVFYEVRIAMERNELRRGDLRGEVKLGLTGTAEIVIDRQSILALLLKNIQHSISLG